MGTGIAISLGSMWFGANCLAADDRQTGFDDTIVIANTSVRETGSDRDGTDGMLLADGSAV